MVVGHKEIAGFDNGSGNTSVVAWMESHTVDGHVHQSAANGSMLVSWTAVFDSSRLADTVGGSSPPVWPSPRLVLD
jgi:hypothetical protein